ncbi:hypothetical protein RhiTH_011619 [Rhizoctonia solani]
MPPRTCSALRSAHQLVEAHPVNLHANSDAKTDTRNLTRLYNYPPDNPQSREYVSRRCRSISANLQHMRADVSSQTKPAQGAKQHKHKLQNPLKVNKSASSDPAGPMQSSQQRRRLRAARPILPSSKPGSTNTESKEPIQTQQPGASRLGRQRGRSSSIRPIFVPSSSPEVEPERTSQGQSQPQPACTLETLNHKGLLRYAQEEFNINGSGWNTQTIICHLQLAQAQQALQMGSSWRPLQPPKPLTGSKNNISGTSNHNEDLGSTEEPPNPTEPGSKSWAPTACQHGQNKSLCPADLNTCKDPSNALQQRLYCCPIIAAPTTPLVTCTQLCLPPKKNITTHGQRAGGSWRLDPVSTAQANMLKFNKAVAQGKAPSLIKSVRRKSQGATQCGSPTSRPPDGLLEDNEEDLAQAKAHAKSRNLMVNNIATLQGKTKERLRKFVESICGFEQSLTNQNIIRKNLGIFNKIYPNTFHCKNWDSCKGDYKNPNIGRCVALAFFHSPGLVGVMYPDYFQEMPITIVAFALAIWLYCIKEWENGWHQNGNLGMAAMREKYKAQLAGLKELRKVAPRRLRQLQMEWQDYVA